MRVGVGGPPTSFLISSSFSLPPPLLPTPHHDAPSPPIYLPRPPTRLSFEEEVGGEVSLFFHPALIDGISPR